MKFYFLHDSAIYVKRCEGQIRVHHSPSFVYDVRAWGSPTAMNVLLGQRLYVLPRIFAGDLKSYLHTSLMVLPAVYEAPEDGK